MDINSLRYSFKKLELNNWKLLKVVGADSERFLHSQLTSDVRSLKDKESQLSARLDRSGRLQSYFYLSKTDDSFLILIETILYESLIENLNKYIIMDDVEIKSVNENLFLYFNVHLTSKSLSTIFNIDFYGINGALSFTNIEDVQEVPESELENIRILNGHPLWGKDITEKMLINETILNDLAISYNKGCFLGQETAAKIQNNRGAAYYPSLVKLSTNLDIKNSEKLLFNDEIFFAEKKIGVFKYHVQINECSYLQVTLLRDFRVEGRRITFNINQLELMGEVSYLPYFKTSKKEEISLELYHQGITEFQKNNDELALMFFEKSLLFNSTLEEAVEASGVILGRLGRYQEAIEWMDKLLLENPKSVMAHTNKSIYFMKLGNIEKAEEEKSLATTKSFAYFGNEAKLKKQQEAEKQASYEKLLKREKMFEEVLSIDPDDLIALYGKSDIHFHRKEYLEAKDKLEKILNINKKYSLAYLLLGKTLECLSLHSESIKIYQEGIEIASKQGELMPANEMQYRLNQLIMSSSLS